MRNWFLPAAEEIFSEKYNAKIRVFEVISLYISYTVRDSYSQTFLVGFLTQKNVCLDTKMLILA